MSKGEKSLMEVRKPCHHCTAVSATPDDKNSNWPLQQLRIDSVCHRCAASSFRRYSFNGSISISMDRGKLFFPARCFQRAAVPPLRFVSRPAPPGWVNSLWKNACCHADIEATVTDLGIRMVPAHTAPLLSMFQ